MRVYRYSGFSLIELMVVVAIIAILSAVSLTNYKTYINQAQISTALATLHEINQQITMQYNTGSNLSSVTIDGQTLSDNQSITLNTGAINYVTYLAPGGYIGFTNEWFICAGIAGLNFPGYVENTNDDQLCIATFFEPGTTQNFHGANGQGADANDVLTSLCGSWSQGDLASIPQEYLPPGCNCPNISTNTCD